MLISGLPLESNFMRELGALRPGQWHNTEELLAAVVTELRVGNFYFLKANVKKGAHVSEPQPIHRPGHGSEQHRRQPMKAEELAAALGRGPGKVRYTPAVKDT